MYSGLGTSVFDKKGQSTHFRKVKDYLFPRLVGDYMIINTNFKTPTSRIKPVVFAEKLNS